MIDPITHRIFMKFFRFIRCSASDAVTLKSVTGNYLIFSITESTGRLIYVYTTPDDMSGDLDDLKAKIVKRLTFEECKIAVSRHFISTVDKWPMWKRMYCAWVKPPFPH